MHRALSSHVAFLNYIFNCRQNQWRNKIVHPVLKNQVLHETHEERMLGASTNFDS